MVELVGVLCYFAFMVIEAADIKIPEGALAPKRTFTQELVACFQFLGKEVTSSSAEKVILQFQQKAQEFIVRENSDWKQYFDAKEPQKGGFSRGRMAVALGLRDYIALTLADGHFTDKFKTTKDNQQALDQKSIVSQRKDHLNYFSPGKEVPRTRDWNTLKSDFEQALKGKTTLNALTRLGYRHVDAQFIEWQKTISKDQLVEDPALLVAFVKKIIQNSPKSLSDLELA